MDIPTIPSGSGFPPRGLYRCSDAQYHAMPGLSSTRIKRMALSPAEFRAQFDEPPEDTEAMRFGRGFHALSLEGRDEFDRRFVRMPAGELRGAEKVTAWRQRCTDILGGPIDWPADAPAMRQAFIDAAAARGLDVVDEDWVATMEAMHASAMANPNIAALMDGEGLNEVCLFDEWEITDDDGKVYRFRVRGKLDRTKIVGDKTIGSDFKTIPTFGVGVYMGPNDDGSERWRWPKVEKYGREYFVPHAAKWYERLWDGLADVHGMPPLLLTFCFAEKQAPHRVLWVTPTTESLAGASVEIDRWLVQIGEGRERGRWPGVPVGLQAVDM